MEDYFLVSVGDFAENHFIKSFKKKYKNNWDLTLDVIKEQLKRIDNLLLTDKAETIIDAGEIKIIKTEFRVIGTKESAKSSGNRCIVAWDKKRFTVDILLIYGKTDLSGKNETAEWKSLVKKNYPEYKNLF